MRINFLPKTILGNWPVGLIIVFFLLFALLQLLVSSDQQGGETFFDNLILAVLALLMGISGVLAFFLGLIGIIKSKERSVLVFLTTAFGLFVLIFMLGEFLSPH